ncbi:putative MAPEG superfamily protein [Paenochrobactrum gallinarii]|uniref:Putative MAPEG superfamily protein n=1 Tax=Paenochrobactrum gallinarii TaxID=643673 RepID=A0A841LT28_9HYPH|nr:MAPEG family protein [Paenochrobactrum gallinarii]MBB6260060.1 putative MAPEG superfamily protein [Paenochrobactrum gallinarii]
MTPELYLLTATLVLAIIHVMAPAAFRNRETGSEYNMGPRDEQGPPVGIITARLQRAQKNFYETLPLFIAAVLIAHIAGKTGTLTLTGAWLFVLARFAYLPLYAIGQGPFRSISWGISMLGLLLVLVAVIVP